MKKLKFRFNEQRNLKAQAQVIKQVAENVGEVYSTERCNVTDTEHKIIKSKFNDEKHKFAYVGKEVILRAYVSKDSNRVYLGGQWFYTTVNYSPYNKALAKASGDLNKIGKSSLPICHWDKDTKQIVKDYTVITNHGEVGKDTIYKETPSLCIVNYSMLETSLRSIYKDTPQIIESEKQRLIDESFTMGLDLQDDGYVACRTNPKGTLYNLISWSNSNERAETATFTSLDIDKAFRKIDEVSGGALSAGLKRERTIQELVKFSKREGILASPSVKTTTIGNEEFGIVIYMKETEGPEDYDDENRRILKDAQIKIDRNTYDGAVVYSAKYIRAMFRAIGIRISLSQANVLALQSRCSVLLSKVFGEGKSQKNINHRAKVYTSTVDPNRILRVKAGTDVSDKDKKDYDLIIVGNEKNIGMIIDKNGAKALNDISLQDIVNGNYMNYILDIAQCSETSTSGQALQKPLSVDKAATIKAMAHLTNNSFNTRLNDYLEGDLDVRNCSLERFMLRHVEKGVNNTAALQSLMKAELAQIESQLKNYRVKLDSVFLRALFDDSYFLTKGAIDGVLSASKYTGKLEAYSYDVELRYKDQIDAIYADDSIVDKEKATDELLTGSVFKFPSPSGDETVAMTFKTSRVLVERIANMKKLTKHQKEILTDDFVNTSFGVIKMAPDNTIKHRLAGMDTDYDGVAVVFEKMFTDILLKGFERRGDDGLTVIKSI